MFTPMVTNRQRCGSGFNLHPHQKDRTKNLLKFFWQDQKGQNLTEYALLLALLALGTITSIKTVASTINGVFWSAASKIGTAAGP